MKDLSTLCKVFQKALPDDSPEQIREKNFYNSILADKKPYFFIYKYRQLDKELKEYNRKNDANCQTRFYMGLEDLKRREVETPELMTEEQRVFMMYYRKFLPVLDSDCVMNKICHHIEGVDFQIKRKVRSGDGFDWRVLVSENFQPEKKLTGQILTVLEEELAKKHIDLKTLKMVSPELVKKNSLTNRDEFDKEIWFQLIAGRLEEICSNEEKLANHLVYIFYEVRTSLNKSILWSVAGRQIYQTVRAKVGSFYFPVKNPQGSLKFLYENYSIERIVLDREDEAEVEREEIVTEW